MGEIRVEKLVVYYFFILQNECYFQKKKEILNTDFMMIIFLKNVIHFQDFPYIMSQYNDLT